MPSSVRTVVFLAGYAQVNIISRVLLDTSFGQHDAVLYFGFPQGWAVVGNGTSFCLPCLSSLELAVPLCVLSTFHNELGPRAMDPRTFSSLKPSHSCLRYDGPHLRAAKKVARGRWGGWPVKKTKL